VYFAASAASAEARAEPLYRASALAEKFGYATNKVGMYLARRRSAGSGIYQATSFKNKPPGRTGLKMGGQTFEFSFAVLSPFITGDAFAE
jgi:hypothetical protein